MPPLTLPPRSPATLRAFWLTISGLTGLTTGAALAGARRDARWLATALPIAALVAAPGLRSPQSVALPYRAWNKAGRISGRLATGWVTRVAFGALLASRRSGELQEMPVSSTGASAWRPRRSQPASAYVNQDASPVRHADLDAFDRYAEQPDHTWARSLRPLVRLLQAIQTEDDADDLPPPDIYTLY